LYNDSFYRYIQEGSTRAARFLVPLILKELPAKDVLDVGCGAGAWLAEYRSQGVTMCLGIDGDYVKRETLLIPSEYFQSEDLTRPFNLQRQFDLVQCLEVGEHLPKSAAETLIGNLVRHGETILFSAATPGQGGQNHINEQPFQFWRTLFAMHRYEPYDFIRPLLKDVKEVEFWYRWNMILYVADTRTFALQSGILHTRIPSDRSIPEVSSRLHRLRARAVSVLPVTWVSKLAILKHRLVRAYRSTR
jgi:SAM-dependent methyltransferase